MGQVRWKVSDFTVKKEPRQARSKASVQAMVQACARILESRGYAGLSTNAIAEVAGVSIGSVYEYFPGKDAIVARLVQDMVAEARAMLEGRLALTDSRNDLNSAMQYFLGAIYRLMRKHRELLRVLVFQVPYLHQLPATRQLEIELQQVLMAGLDYTREQYSLNAQQHTLYLMTTSVAGTLMHLVLVAPPAMDPEGILDALAEKMTAWLIEG
ncbi:TetR/AcrR family transcriptional regulator [Alcanivorax sp.]|jgi:AcrR family transcriptional regulator|uniref:TetR/AcrR family transcriptional regulator n=2 Tax=Alcanivorax TaxID=59753 RepID=UPI0025EBCAAA|nr:TetR/AcrR family transcriptional regulator [Alcanivorax sp.]